MEHILLIRIFLYGDRLEITGWSQDRENLEIGEVSGIFFLGKSQGKMKNSSEIGEIGNSLV